MHTGFCTTNNMINKIIISTSRVQTSIMHSSCQPVRFRLIDPCHIILKPHALRPIEILMLLGEAHNDACHSWLQLLDRCLCMLTARAGRLTTRRVHLLVYHTCIQCFHAFRRLVCVMILRPVFRLSLHWGVRDQYGVGARWIFRLAGYIIFAIGCI